MKRYGVPKDGEPFASFILAHEAGHILLHDNSAKAFSNQKTSQLSFIPPEDSAEEQANQFAGHLLLPTRTITKFNDAEMLAVLCNVPDQLAEERLAAVRRQERHLAGLKDYCRDCGDFAEVSNGLCNGCVHKVTAPKLG
jgi:IrrE N-terminal-like domain